MSDKILEKNLREFDYSVFSKVKKILLEKILKNIPRPQVKNFKICDFK